LIDRASLIPIYQQIKNEFIQRIASGELQGGQKLPSEREISDQYLISRPTVRQAFKELANEGKIRIVSGKGAFVAEPRLTSELRQLRGFTAEIESLGMKAASKILRQAIIQSEDGVATLFGRPRGHKFLKVDRLRYGNGVPLALERAYFDLMVCPHLDAVDLSGSVYQTLAEKLNVAPVYAKQQIESYHPSAQEAQYLSIRENVPCLLIKRQTYASTGLMFESVEAVFRGDIYTFAVELGELPPRN